MVTSTRDLNSNSSNDTEEHMERTFICGECSCGFKTQEDFDNHLSHPHNGGCVFKCTLCGKTFNNNKDLQSHLTTEHMNPSNFICDMCDYSTNKSSDLLNHKFEKHVAGPVESENISYANLLIIMFWLNNKRLF